MTKEKAYEVINKTKNVFAVGSCRDVYVVDNYIVKKNKNIFGYKQSENERLIYEFIRDRNCSRLLAAPLYLDENYSVYDFFEPVTISLFVEDESIYDLTCRDSFDDIFNADYFYDEVEFGLGVHHLEEELVPLLTEHYDVMYDDLYMSGNIGRTKDGEIRFLDYGMTNSLYTEYEVFLRG